MRSLLVTLLTLGLATQTHAGDKLNIVLGSGLDLASSEVAFSRGAVEANPMMKDRYIRFGAKTVASATAIVFTDELKKHGHPNGAKWFSRGWLGFFAGVAVWNLTQKGAR
jgi:hypothetical protein